jgi:hypothetical protein
MVTSRHFIQRHLHTIVSGMCGRNNSCRYKVRPLVAGDGKVIVEAKGDWQSKIDYRSQPSAERAAMQLQRKTGRDFDVYQCWYCRGWHVGGAQPLTPGLFLRIFLFWIIRRKRTGAKL